VRRRAALCLVLAGCARGPNLEAIVRPYLEARTLSGVSIAVAQHGKVVAERSFGRADLENDVPARADTVYAIGPITKEFTAVAVLQLVAAGRIALDDDVRKFLPDFPANGRHVAIQNLLSHTSGLKDFEYDAWWRSKALERGPDDLLALWFAAAALFAPGEAFGYSSTDYALLGAVVEKAAGQPLDAYLRERVIVPAGLRSTRPCSQRAIVPGRAAGYTLLGGQLVHADLVVLDQYGGAGALCSTLEDLLLWVENRAGLVPPALRSRLGEPGALADGTRIGYGYGFIVSSYRGHRFVGNQGSVPGYAAALYHFVDDDVTVAVLANTDSVDAMKIEGELAAQLLGAPAPEFKAAETPLAPGELALVLGSYARRAAGDRPIVVAARGGRVLVDDRPVRHIAERTFVDRSGQVLRFGDVDGGRAHRLELDFFGIRLEARRQD
jgi:CubicO group peptidase (beta-lactamase class C family)